MVVNVRFLSLGYGITAVVVTTFRLIVRGRVRWWWDDLFALLGALSIVVQVVVLWVLTAFIPAIYLNQKLSVALYYLNSITFYLEDWCARLAILYSVIRITPGDKPRHILHYVTIGYYLGFLVNVGMLFGYCESDTSWQESLFPVCQVAKPVPIYQIVAGIISDTILIALPIQTLSLLTSAPVLRKRLIIIFSASVLMTIACVTQSTISIIQPGFPQLIAGLTEGFVAIIVCNLAVTVIALLHLLGFSNGLEQRPTGDTADGDTSLQFSPGSHPSLSYGLSIPRHSSGMRGGEDEPALLDSLHFSRVDYESRTDSRSGSGGMMTMSGGGEMMEVIGEGEGDGEESSSVKDHNIGATTSNDIPPAAAEGNRRKKGRKRYTAPTETFWERWKSLNVDAGDASGSVVDRRRLVREQTKSTPGHV